VVERGDSSNHRCLRVNQAHQADPGALPARNRLLCPFGCTALCAAIVLRLRDPPSGRDHAVCHEPTAAYTQSENKTQATLVPLGLVEADIVRKRLLRNPIYSPFTASMSTARLRKQSWFSENASIQRLSDAQHARRCGRHSQAERPESGASGTSCQRSGAGRKIASETCPRLPFARELGFAAHHSLAKAYPMKAS